MDAVAVATPGERAYADYFAQRRGLNSQGNPLPLWADLPAEIQAWWQAAAIRPPGSPAWWKTGVFWFNAIVLLIAAIEDQLGVLKDLLPGSIYAWVAFALPLANAGIKAVRLMGIKLAGDAGATNTTPGI